MPTRGQILAGTFLIFFGGTLLLANILHVNLWAVCCPVGIIFVGFVMLFPSARRTWTSDDSRYNTPQKF
jgi:uncharacterized membrane protein YgdD (TMEM256/DUF423 family)